MKVTVQVQFLAASLSFLVLMVHGTPTRKCGECDKTKCPDLTNCPREHVIIDMCNCCEVCVTYEELNKPKPKADMSVCSNIDCPKFELCMLNIQELPVCRCPSRLSCPQVKGQEICGQDKVTYKSRCLKNVAECQQKRKIKTAYKGRCIENINLASRRKLEKISRQELRRKRKRRQRKRDGMKVGHKRKRNKANRKHKRMLKHRTTRRYLF